MEVSKMRRQLSAVFATFLLSAVLVYVQADAGVRQRCKDKCKVILREIDTFDDFKCNATCRNAQCEIGCNTWEEGANYLFFSCSNECNSKNVDSNQHVNQFCVMGCDTAVDLYAQDVLGQLQGLERPTLLPKSQSNVSVILHWPIPQVANTNNITVYLQKRYTQFPDSWKYHDNIILNSSNIFVENLRPYASYKFKMVIFVTPQYLVESPESFKIRTQPYGVPSSPPRISSLSSSRPTVITMTWNPPHFTNGPIVGYRISVTNLGTQTIIKTLELVNQTSYIINQLEPGTGYQVSIAAINTQGVGPTEKKNVTTLSRPALNGSTPYLIFGVDNKIYQQDISDIAGVTQYINKELYANNNGSVQIKGLSVLYNGSANVTGVAVHVEKQLIFFSDTSKVVQRMSLTDYNKAPVIIYSSNEQLTSLSVDWLNDHLYVVENGKILQCSLEGNPCLVVVNGLSPSPEILYANPFHDAGFLYWTQLGTGLGIYRVNLADLQGSTNGVTPKRVVKRNSISALTIDLQNERLYFIDQSMNAIQSCTLNGSDVTIVHPNTQSPAYQEVISLAEYNGQFFVTDGSSVSYEEYQEDDDLYHVNPLIDFMFHDSYSSLNVYHPSAQIIPVPSAAPQDVQAVFTSKTAKVTWKKPYIQEIKLKWKYHLEVYIANNLIHLAMDITETEYEVHNLTASTGYSFRVQAYSGSGNGPWSEMFTGQTFKQGAVDPHILYADLSGLYTMNIDGTNQTAVYPTSDGGAILDLAVDQGAVFWVLENSTVYHHDRSTLETEQVQHITDATAIAYDWIGKKIYWSDTRRNMISRSFVNGSAAKTIYQSAAHDLAIDSVHGYIYWTNSLSVNHARLNGEDFGSIYGDKTYLSRQRALGITIDQDSGSVYWIVAGSGQYYYLYRAALAGYGNGDIKETTSLIGSVDALEWNPVLSYYDDHLFWFNSQSKLTIGNTKGHFPAVIGEAASNMTTFIVVHPSLLAGIEVQDHDNQTVYPAVYPSTINISTIQGHGSWDHFNISWHPATGVTHGKVLYEISLQYNGTYKYRVVDAPYLLLQNFSPYTHINITIRPYTYWHTAYSVWKTLRTPMTAPSTPRQPHTYTSLVSNDYDSGQQVSIEFRWKMPSHFNGLLANYSVYYRHVAENEWKNKSIKDNSTLHFTLEKAAENSLYYFKVAACTIVGCSNTSDIAIANTSITNPPPKLLLNSRGSFSIFDVDSSSSAGAKTNNTQAVSVAYIARDSVQFLITTHNELMQYDGVKMEMLHQLRGNGSSLSVDWVARVLYWVETLYQRAMIKKLDLQKGESSVQTVYTVTDAAVKEIQLNPLDSKLYWQETKTSTPAVALFEYNIKRRQSTQILPPTSNRVHVKRRAVGSVCNCPTDTVLGEAYTLYVNPDQTELYWVDLEASCIWRSDPAACHCQKIVDSTAVNIDFPPSALSVDDKSLYLLNTTTNQLYMVDKYTGKLKRILPVPGVNSIKAYGVHLQPVPDISCLRLSTYKHIPQFLEHTNSSITLDLPAVEADPQCTSISMPTIEYIIFYGKIGNSNASKPDCGDFINCKNKSILSNTGTVRKLEPYTDYVFQVAVRNHYTPTYSGLGPSAYYRTKFGTPTSVQNITIKSVNPEKLKVMWHAPKHPNGPIENLTYVVNWKTINHLGHRISGNTTRAQYYDKKRKMYMTQIHNLTAGQTYGIQVLAYDVSGLYYNSSTEVSGTTYMSPGPIQLVNRSQDNMTVLWQPPADNSIIRHKIVCAPVNKKGKEPRPSTMRNTKKDNVPETFTGLSANTQYAFAVMVLYPASFEYYRWPNDTRFSFWTRAVTPGKPSSPKIYRPEKDIYEIKWIAPADDGGSNITRYLLEHCCATPGNWSVAYNGSFTEWKLKHGMLDGGHRYVFRVTAKNKLGWGPTSDNSTSIFYPVIFPSASTADGDDDLYVTLGTSFAILTVLVATAVVVVILAAASIQEDESLTAGLSATFGVLIVLILIAVVGLIYVFRKRRRDSERLKNLSYNYQNGNPYDGPHSPDIELATLREMPRMTFHQNAALYAMGIIPTDEDIAALPHFRRDQLALTKLLGSGAFGEVYEGVANDVGEQSGETKVAVKTLRNGALESEKEEFLKEALLMSNFKHEHILRLLGVCLDNDPQFIILELMDGGDLLSFLRSCRPTPLKPSPLTFPDLVSIALDVAKGCRYLEDMHFVHRDIAARNCLVSKTSTSGKVTVKIGDFGLARDIYRNDYYRKEGEGLLPVRWMSPEALIDGVFTTQTDVWAYGVLVWEVITLGQQPYPARTNIEVLHFVRGGGRLDRPENCPTELYGLMLKCWSFSPPARPSFYEITDEMVQFVEQSKDPRSHFSGAWKLKRSGGGFDNLAFESSPETSKTPYKFIVALPPESHTYDNEKLGGSVRLTPDSKKKRLQSLIGSADIDNIENESRGAEAQALGNPDIKHNKIKKAFSFDQKNFPARGIAHRQPSNANDYLRAKGQSQPKYLDLLQDDDPPGAASHPGAHINTKNTNTDRVNYADLAGVVPAEPSVSANAGTVNYAHLAGSDMSDSDIDTDNPSVIGPPRLGVSGVLLSPSKNTQNGQTKKPTNLSSNINYAQIATPANSTDNEQLFTDFPGETSPTDVPHQINYAQLSPPSDRDSAIFIDSDQPDAFDSSPTNGTLNYASIARSDDSFDSSDQEDNLSSPEGMNTIAGIDSMAKKQTFANSSESVGSFTPRSMHKVKYAPGKKPEIQMNPRVHHRSVPNLKTDAKDNDDIINYATVKTTVGSDRDINANRSNDSKPSLNTNTNTSCSQQNTPQNTDEGSGFINYATIAPAQESSVC